MKGNLKKNSFGYIQLSLRKFMLDFPHLVRFIPNDIDKNDTDYFVRIDEKNGLVEFGYLSDDWAIK